MVENGTCSHYRLIEVDNSSNSNSRNSTLPETTPKRARNSVNECCMTIEWTVARENPYICFYIKE